MIFDRLNDSDDWIEWNGAAEVPEPVKTAKRLWVRYRDGEEQEKHIGIAVNGDAWKTQAFLWKHDRPSMHDVVAYRVE